MPELPSGAPHCGRISAVDPARRAQASAIRALREQARRAAAGLVEDILEAPSSAEVLRDAASGDAQALARALWSEALVVVYQALFRLKLEAEPGRVFGSSDLRIEPLGGALFGAGSTPLLDRVPLPERAAERLLNELSWAPSGKNKNLKPARVDYGRLAIEDIGRVHEALLELEPGIATEPMCRLRRQKLEVVVPASEGDRYARRSARVRRVEEIAPGKFYLRAGLGRKSSGSYYTPPELIRYLVEEALGPQVAERSPPGGPRPLAILALRVLDPAMGAGHFLMEACRFLGDRLHEACRRCDELAAAAEAQAAIAPPDKRKEFLQLARDFRRRVEDLPGLGEEMLAQMPSRAPGGSGFSRGISIARRLVVIHCLYGVDKNPLAVELAKISLWLTAGAEGSPPPLLDPHLFRGDSIAGPFFERLATYPKSGAAVPEFVNIRRPAASTGGSTRDLALLAQAWSGGVMLGEQADDEGYRLLMEAISKEGDARAIIAARPSVGRMIEMGRDALAFDVVFPDVFYKNTPELKGSRLGFDAVIGNPPWDAVRPKAKEFFAAIDLRVLDAPTKRERAAVEEELRKDARVAALESAYEAEVRHSKRLHDRLFEHQTALVGGARTGGDPDMAKLFAERFVELCRPSGRVGVLLPSAFHANAGATGVRRLYLDKMAITACVSFENRRKLFEIDSRFKYDLLVAVKEPPRADFMCAFYRHDPAWLAGEKADALRYTPRFVAETGGEHRALLELRSAADLEVAERCFSRTARFLEFCDRSRIRLGRELHMTDDAWRFMPVSEALPAPEDPRDPKVMAVLLQRGQLLLHDDKTFTSLSDLTRKWRPRYLVPLNRLSDRPDWARAAATFRVAFRKITGATNERTTIAHILPPGSVFGDATFCERDPFKRPTSRALVLLGLLTSFCYDWLVRLRAQSNLNLFLVNATPVPEIPAAALIAHSVLRLACNHEGYAPLWEEQLGDAWREPAAKEKTWPVIEGDAARWRARAAIDAVIAAAYRLSRDQYERVLSSFTHKTNPLAPALCLAAFDELQARGLDDFAKARDPYWDIPLPEGLPEPVIELSPPSMGGAFPVPPTSSSAGLRRDGPGPSRRRLRK